MIRNTATHALRSPLPGSFYRDEGILDQLRDRVFLPSWQWAFGPEGIPAPAHVRPFTLLPGYLDEPLLAMADEQGNQRITANVCSHRGNLLTRQAGPCRHLVCPYHGRRFGLDGSCISQPGLGAVPDFPGEEDHLRRPGQDTWAGFHFVRMQDGLDFTSWIQPVRRRVDFLPLDQLVHAPDQSQDYTVKANWALYCENYLEGLHIPFVHPALREALNLAAYPVITDDYSVLQIGMAREGEPAFDLPVGHPDQGQHIYAWYYWLYPNLMINVYPWGLSINVVEPIGIAETRIRFLTYRFAGQSGGPDTHALHDTELEDESVVETVQQGVRSSLYSPGRMVPGWEDGVVHFHQLLVSHLS